MHLTENSTCPYTFGMALKIADIKEEIRVLTKERAELDERIAGLQRYIDAPKSVAEGKAAVSVSTRGGPDIRPMLLELFSQNGNAAMRLKEIVSKVVSAHSELDRAYVDGKLRYLKNHYLEQAKESGYGMYRLPPG